MIHPYLCCSPSSGQRELSQTSVPLVHPLCTSVIRADPLYNLSLPCTLWVRKQGKILPTCMVTGSHAWPVQASVAQQSSVKVIAQYCQLWQPVLTIGCLIQLHPGLAAICSTHRSEYVLIFSQISVLANMAVPVHQIGYYRDIVNQFQTPGWCVQELGITVVVMLSSRLVWWCKFGWPAAKAECYIYRICRLAGNQQSIRAVISRNITRGFLRREFDMGLDLD